MESFLWTDKPFNRAAAWVDLLLLAVWKDSKEMYRGELVQRKAGEVNCSIEWLSDRWGWNRKTVMKFLDILEKEKMVTQTRTGKGTTLTLVNWAKYQGQGTTERTPERTPDWTPERTPDWTHYKKDKKAEESSNKAEEERALDELRKQRDEVLKKWEA